MEMPEVSISLAIYLIIGVVTLLMIYKTWQNRKSYKFGIYVLSVVGCVALAGAFGTFEFLGIQKEKRIETAVERYTGKDWSVSCENQMNEFFKAPTADTEQVWVEDNIIKSRMTTCNNINDYIQLQDKDKFDSSQVFAVHWLNRAVIMKVMTHGGSDKSAAECYAMQNDHILAQSMGATLQQGLDFREYYHKNMFPNVRQEWASPECRGNGPYDLTNMENPLFGVKE